MFGELMGGEDPGRGNPEQSWLICLKVDLKAFGATHGSTADEPCVFGVPKLVWTEAAKVKGGVPRLAGVLQRELRDLWPLGTRPRRRRA